MSRCAARSPPAAAPPRVHRDRVAPDARLLGIGCLAGRHLVGAVNVHSSGQWYPGMAAFSVQRPIPAHPIPQYRLAASFRWSNVWGTKPIGVVDVWGVRSCGCGRFCEGSRGIFSIAIGRSCTICAARVRNGSRRTARCRRVSGGGCGRGQSAARPRPRYENCNQHACPLEAGYQGCAQPAGARTSGVRRRVTR